MINPSFLLNHMAAWCNRLVRKCTIWDLALSCLKWLMVKWGVKHVNIKCLSKVFKKEEQTQINTVTLISNKNTCRIETQHQNLIHILELKGQVLAFVNLKRASGHSNKENEWTTATIFYHLISELDLLGFLRRIHSLKITNHLFEEVAALL